jgi:hypothetical protein
MCPCPGICEGLVPRDVIAVDRGRKWLVDVAVRDGVAVISNSENWDNLNDITGNLQVVDLRTGKTLANPTSAANAAAPTSPSNGPAPVSPRGACLRKP